MRRRLAVAVVALSVVIAACGSTPPAPSQGAGPAQRASDVRGAFELTFTLPGTEFRAGQPIEGRATLGVVGGTPVAFGSSGSGPFVFDFKALDGTHHVSPIMPGDCAPYRLEPGTPMTSPITKSGSYGDDPDSAFIESFLDGPIVRLPEGRWRITAIASLVESEDCRGTSRELAAPIVIQVVP